MATDEQQRLINANPMTLTDAELKSLLAMGTDAAVINGTLVPIGPQSPRWIAWKVEYDSRQTTKQLRFIKYSAIAAGITALAALATAAIALIQVITKIP